MNESKQHQSLSTGAFHKRNKRKTTFLVDNRPEALVQRKLLEMPNNRPNVKLEGQLMAIMSNYSGQQSQPIQRVKHKNPKRKPSKRIATYKQIEVRGKRNLRGARKRDIAPFNPGAPVQTSFVNVPGLGGKGLLCPRGSYIKKVSKFTYTGSRTGDFTALGGTPTGQVWHHYHDYNKATNTGSMYLITKAQHKAGHYGGVSQWNSSHNTKYQ